MRISSVNAFVGFIVICFGFCPSIALGQIETNASKACLNKNTVRDLMKVKQREVEYLIRQLDEAKDPEKICTAAPDPINLKQLLEILAQIESTVAALEDRLNTANQ